MKHCRSKISKWLVNAAALPLAAVVLAGVPAGRALADPVQITSLYDADSFVPGFLMPFKLSGDLLTNGTVTSTSISNDASADCRVMPDPFIKNIFLIKCSAAANVTVIFNIVSGKTLTPVHYGPIAVKSLGTLTAIGGGGGGGTPAAQGKALFTKYNCINCHSGNMPRGASPSDISNALATVPDMSFLRGTLTDSDRTLISTYLNSF